MSIKSRLKKLETQQGKADRPGWKQFITGEWIPDPKEWTAFLTMPIVDYRAGITREETDEEKGRENYIGLVEVDYEHKKQTNAA